MQQSTTLNHITIYTVGHSNVEFEKFLSLLNGINVVVDVRSVPFSKYVPQFNIGSIKARLHDGGIEYVFMKDEHVGNVLGGRPKDYACYNNGDVIYERVAGKEWYKKGISALVELANQKNVVVMCGEEDPYKCHRHHLITQSLLKEGITVIHIRGDGTQERVEKPEKKTIQLTLF
ncbi:MAG: DUF488 domain-containing protein [Euryarchaeota archaeon]|nr:DUF488 domain-containing protein [Euryarchaeota archaeon]